MSLQVRVEPTAVFGVNGYNQTLRPAPDEWVTTGKDPNRDAKREKLEGDLKRIKGILALIPDEPKATKTKPTYQTPKKKVYARGDPPLATEYKDANGTICISKDSCYQQHENNWYKWWLKRTPVGQKYKDFLNGMTDGQDKDTFISDMYKIVIPLIRKDENFQKSPACVVTNNPLKGDTCAGKGVNTETRDKCTEAGKSCGTKVTWFDTVYTEENPLLTNDTQKEIAKQISQQSKNQKRA